MGRSAVEALARKGLALVAEGEGMKEARERYEEMDAEGDGAVEVEETGWAEEEEEEEGFNSESSRVGGGAKWKWGEELDTAA